MIQTLRTQTRSSFFGKVWAVTIAAAIGGYGAISFISGSVAGPFTAVTIPFRVLIALVSLLLVGRAVIIREKPIPRTVLGVLAFVLLYGIRMYTDLDRLGSDQLLKQLAFLGGVAIVPGLATFMAGERAAYQLLIKTLFAIYVLVGILGLRGITEDTMETGRLLANQYFNPIDLGHAGVSLLLISVYGLLQTSRGLAYARNLMVYVGGAALGASVLALSGSRGPVTAGVLCLGVLLFASAGWGIRAAGRRRAVVLLTLVVAAIGALSIITRYGGTLLDRVTSLSDTRTGDTESRLPMYEEAFDTMTSNPIIGSTTLLSNGMYPHNAILEAGISLGILGAVAMAAFLFFVVRRSVKLAYGGDDAGLLGLLALQQVIACQVSGAIWSNDSTWTMALLIIGVELPARRQMIHVVHTSSSTTAGTPAASMVLKYGSQ